MRKHFKIQQVRRCWGLVFINILLNHQFVFRLIGWLNGRLDFLVSIFIAYPASEEYANYYFAPAIVEHAQWKPILCGLLRQNGKWILGFGISNLEKDFHADLDSSNLKLLLRRAEQLQMLTKSRQVTFSGILPGLLNRRCLRNDQNEATVTVQALLHAIELVKRAEGIETDIPVIVLGGKGYIGSYLLRKLGGLGCSVDMASSTDVWPEHLAGKPAILVNVAHRKALRQYSEKLWSGLILLNEVYPEPSKREISEFTKLGNAAYHVVGVEAFAFPSFPKAYAGGIPCCAGWANSNLSAMIRKLN